MSTPYNPQGFRDNCGFCSISRGLQLQKGAAPFRDADQLYQHTIQRLGLATPGNAIPVSRQLIFPEPQLGTMKPRPGYERLGEQGRSLTDYVITSVASSFDLEFSYQTKNAAQMRQTADFLPERFVKFQAKQGNNSRSAADFLEMRMDYLADKGLHPSLPALRGHLMRELVGHAIIGSKESNHYMTLQVEPDLTVIGFDPQDGATYDGAGLVDRLRSIDLFLHLK